MSKNPHNKISHLITPFQMDPKSIKILEESTIGIGVNRIKFKAILQERDVINNNKRTYSENILRMIVAQLGPKATERKLLAELDHPISDSSDKFTQLKRTATISLKEACIVITKLEFDGRYIVAECETLTTPAGMIIYSLLKDKVVFGFSLRALGSTQQNPNGTITVMEDGFKAITFDAVSNPSHSNAIITEILSESTDLASIIKSLKQVRDEVNEINITESTLKLLSNNPTPEILQESYFIGGVAKYIDKNITEQALEVIMESEGVIGTTNAKDYSLNNTVINGTIEEAISYFTNMSNSNKIIGFKW